MMRFLLSLCCGILLAANVSLLGQVEPTDTDNDGFYNISTLDHLRWISENPESWSWDLELDNDIDASDTRNWNIGDTFTGCGDPITTELGWSPIGTSTNKFTGSIEGHGYTIYNLYIFRPRQHWVGLIGTSDGDTNKTSNIKNLNLLDVDITGFIECGSIVGSTGYWGDIINCHVTGKISGWLKVGGISGSKGHGKVDKCSFIGEVEAFDIPCSNTRPFSTGGLFGRSYATITKSFAEATVIGWNRVGGICGHSQGNMADCYFRGSVSGKSQVGGLCAEFCRSVVNCYSACEITIENNTQTDYFLVKKIDLSHIGFPSPQSQNCFWDSELSGIDKTTTATCQNIQEMKTEMNFTAASWDFENIWQIHPLINDGYPCFVFANSLPPYLISPPDHSQNVPINTELRWGDDFKNDRYMLELSYDELFTSIVTNPSTSEKSLNVGFVLKEDTRYFWRVKAVNSNGQSNWSEVWEFTTGMDIEQPFLISPIDNAKLTNEKVTFVWHESEKAENYQILISLDDDFTDIIKDYETSNTSIEFSGFDKETEYFWKVLAKAEHNESEWSEVWSFTIHEKPDQVMLISPEKGSINIPLNSDFHWHSIENATHYDFHIAEDYHFEDRVNSSEITEPHINNITLEYDHEYYWKVYASINDLSGEESEIWNFHTILPPTELIEPYNNSCNLDITQKLVWQKIDNYDKYFIQIATSAEFNNQTIVENAKVFNNSYLPELLESYTTYYWRVRIEGEAGKYGVWSDTWNFKTGIQRTVLRSPDNYSENIEFIRRDFKWFDVVGADYYHLQISASEDFKQLIFSRDSITKTSCLVDELMPNTQYWWRVKAWNQENRGKPVWSEEWTFLTDDVYILLRYPIENSIVDLPLQMKWVSSPSEMDSYILQISEHENFTDCIIENEECIDNTFKLQQCHIPDVESGKTYYWRICGKYKNTKTDYTIPWSFTIGNVGVDDIAEDIVIAPQPANHMLKIMIAKLKTSITSYRLVDINGKTIIEKNCSFISGSHEINIDCSELYSGEYLLIFETKRGMVVEKIIIKK